MISYHPHQNLLTDRAEALVNTVNCVGVMGKGIAIEFKRAFPQNFDRYAQACRTNAVYPGRPFITRNSALPGIELMGPKWIINAPTKDHWRDPSEVSWIVSNLESIRDFIALYNVKSIAIPPMGCGNGGLIWRQIHPLFKQILSIPNVDVRIYAENPDEQDSILS